MGHNYVSMAYWWLFRWIELLKRGFARYLYNIEFLLWIVLVNKWLMNFPSWSVLVPYSNCSDGWYERDDPQLQDICLCGWTVYRVSRDVFSHWKISATGKPLKLIEIRDCALPAYGVSLYLMFLWRSTSDDHLCFKKTNELHIWFIWFVCFSFWLYESMWISPHHMARYARGHLQGGWPVQQIGETYPDGW